MSVVLTPAQVRALLVGPGGAGFFLADNPVYVEQADNGWVYVEPKEPDVQPDGSGVLIDKYGVTHFDSVRTGVMEDPWPVRVVDGGVDNGNFDGLTLAISKPPKR